MSLRDPATDRYGQQQKKAKKLTPEELEKSSKRLYDMAVTGLKKRHQEYDDQVTWQFSHNDISSKKVSHKVSEDEEKAIEHLYNQPMERKKINLQNLEKKLGHGEGSATTKTITTEEKDQITERLYTQTIQQKKISMAQSEKRIYGEPPKVRRLDKDSLKASIDHVYTQAKEKKDTNYVALTDKYAWKKQESKKISKDQVADLGQRLATKGGK